ncbi:hypothetical protein CLOM_g10459 [Closterium sp. NIES-68]|nr:hypothetical protein CLOM_g10459 [Closterium sp. NIES-68]GJP74045.1 hypothetical protein CLOP_g4691 [Closterium sp. NIES-67]
MGSARRFSLFIALSLLSFALVASAQYNKWIKGFTATYYANQNSQYGSCGYGIAPGYTASISAPIYAQGQACGACIRVRCVNSGQCIPGTISPTVRITNLCPAASYGGWCDSGKLSVTLSSDVWALIAKNPSVGVVPVEVSRVRCPGGNGVMFNVTGDGFYISVLPLNVGGSGDIKRMDLSVGGGPWFMMRRSFGTVFELVGQPLAGRALSFRIWPRADPKPVIVRNAIPPYWTPSTVYRSKINL